ncbi:hypothetical protein RRG08_042415 [Elysia crispata]|uniref:Uncharacterized protein n=1 Tax=Elysia crispata TaxID=231223 RepID=A0AAE1DDL4_9GAST|nr:hypothetical protein RRG08_042415 [Elysia crispata]
MDMQLVAATNVVKAITILQNFINIHEPERGNENRDNDEDGFVNILPNIHRPRYCATTNAMTNRERLMNISFRTADD